MSYADLRNTNPGEARAASLLIRAALAAGFILSIDAEDGGPVRVSNAHGQKGLDIFRDQLGAVDEQVIRVGDGTQSRGWFLLVWGNAPDGSELLADYSDNPTCAALYDELADRLAW